MIDVVLMQQHIASIITLSDDALNRADVSLKIGVVDMSDVVTMQKFIANIITVLPDYPVENTDTEVDTAVDTDTAVSTDTEIESDLVTDTEINSEIETDTETDTETEVETETDTDLGVISLKDASTKPNGTRVLVRGQVVYCLENSVIIENVDSNNNVEGLQVVLGENTDSLKFNSIVEIYGIIKVENNVPVLYPENIEVISTDNLPIKPVKIKLSEIDNYLSVYVTLENVLLIKISESEVVIIDDDSNEIVVHNLPVASNEIDNLAFYQVSGVYVGSEIDGVKELVVLNAEDVVKMDDNTSSDIFTPDEDDYNNVKQSLLELLETISLNENVKNNNKDNYYTEKSFEEFLDYYTEALKMVENFDDPSKKPTYDELSLLYYNLNVAYTTLEKNLDIEDKTEYVNNLQEALEYAKKYFDNKDLYTTETSQALVNAYNSAKTALENTLSYTNSQLNTLFIDLLDALYSLELLETLTNEQALRYCTQVFIPEYSVTPEILKEVTYDSYMLYMSCVADLSKYCEDYKNKINELDQNKLFEKVESVINGPSLLTYYEYMFNDEIKADGKKWLDSLTAFYAETTNQSFKNAYDKAKEMINSSEPINIAEYGICMYIIFTTEGLSFNSNMNTVSANSYKNILMKSNQFRRTDSNIYGDIDGDSLVNMQDVVTLQQHLAALIALDDDQLKRADVALEVGEVNMIDVITIQRRIADIITELPDYTISPDDTEVNEDTDTEIENFISLTEASKQEDGSYVTVRGQVVYYFDTTVIIENIDPETGVEGLQVKLDDEINLDLYPLNALVEVSGIIDTKTDFPVLTAQKSKIISENNKEILPLHVTLEELVKYPSIYVTLNKVMFDFDSENSALIYDDNDCVIYTEEMACSEEEIDLIEYYDVSGVYAYDNNDFMVFRIEIPEDVVINLDLSDEEMEYELMIISLKDLFEDIENDPDFDNNNGRGKYTIQSFNNLMTQYNLIKNKFEDLLNSDEYNLSYEELLKLYDDLNLAYQSLVVNPEFKYNESFISGFKNLVQKFKLYYIPNEDLIEQNSYNSIFAVYEKAKEIADNIDIYTIEQIEDILNQFLAEFENIVYISKFTNEQYHRYIGNIVIKNYELTTECLNRVVFDSYLDYLYILDSLKSYYYEFIDDPTEFNQKKAGELLTTVQNAYKDLKYYKDMSNDELKEYGFNIYNSLVEYNSQRYDVNFSKAYPSFYSLINKESIDYKAYGDCIYILLTTEGVYLN